MSCYSDSANCEKCDSIFYNGACGTCLDKLEGDKQDLLTALRELVDDLQSRLDMATDGMTEADGLVLAEDANRSWRSWLFDVMRTHGDIAQHAIKNAEKEN